MFAILLFELFHDPLSSLCITCYTTVVVIFYCRDAAVREVEAAVRKTRDLDRRLKARLEEADKREVCRSMFSSG